MKNPTRAEKTMTRRILILQSAAACFVESGFHQTSIRDIADHAGISVGNLYNHFKSKMELIGEIAKLETMELAAIEAGLKNARLPKESIVNFIAQYFMFVSKPENTILGAEIQLEAMRNSDIATGYRSNRNRLISLLSNVLELAENCEESTEKANVILDLIEGAGMRTAFDKKSVRKKALRSVQSMISKLIQ